MAEIQEPLGTIDSAVPSLYVADLDAAIRWYEAALGLQPISLANDIHEAHPHAAYQLGASLIVLEPIPEALEPATPAAENTTINLLMRRDARQVRLELLSAVCSAATSPTLSTSERS